MWLTLPLLALTLSADPVPPRGLKPEPALDTWDEHAEDVENFLKRRLCGALKADARQAAKLLDAHLVAPDLSLAKGEPYATGAYRATRFTMPTEGTARTPAEVAAALERWFTPLAVRSRCSIGFDHFVLSAGPLRVAEARFKLLVAGLGTDGRRIEDLGEVRAELERDPQGTGPDAWRFTRLAFEERLRVVADHARFRDVSVASGVPTELPEAAASRDEKFYNDALDRGGLATGDLNGDGRLDVYVSTEGPGLLLLSTPEGGFQDVTAAWGLTEARDGRGALLLDLDGDGDLDLALVTRGARSRGEVVIYRNEGARFVKATTIPGLPGAGYLPLAAADVDGDGQVDLFVGGYGVFARGFPRAYLDAKNGSPDLLLLNRGHLQFVDRARAWGLAETGWTQAATLVDLDGDGRVDLVAADDFGRKRVYRNTGQRFEDVSVLAGPGRERANGMSIAVGDVDGDGRLDLYFGNMHSNAGQRIASGYVGGPLALRERLFSATQGNTLWLGRAGGFAFEAWGAALGLNDGGWSYGVGAFDVDDDGWLDVHSPCGYLSRPREDEL